ncbi:hypothetical protein [Streptomyces sp. WZ-12]|uniref:hypothetical protein n=1 Tax=Streptomyces sp. WZ-12 TaxID=3030210 RepID=UPI002380F95E|nr:hypothetical protein [Streptomyces sp. WZ-12]
MPGAAQPHSGASTNAVTSAPTHTSTSTVPGRSSACRGPRAERGSSRTPELTASSTTGTLIRKINRQSAAASSPPITGPALAATALTAALTAAQTPTAVARARREGGQRKRERSGPTPAAAPCTTPRPEPATGPDPDAARRGPARPWSRRQLIYTPQRTQEASAELS